MHVAVLLRKGDKVRLNMLKHTSSLPRLNVRCPFPLFVASQGKASEPNQDNFSITRLSNGYSLAVICDGHGKKGVAVIAE